MSNSVLEHIPAVDRALAAAARLLRPGGVLVTTSPTAAFSQQLALPRCGDTRRIATGNWRTAICGAWRSGANTCARPGWKW